jgi:hypothetical protein
MSALFSIADIAKGIDVQAFAAVFSFLAATNTSRAASRFMRKMLRPTTKSGHGEKVAAVTKPATMMATFA